MIFIFSPAIESRKVNVYSKISVDQVNANTDWSSVPNLINTIVHNTGDFLVSVTIVPSFRLATDVLSDNCSTAPLDRGDSEELD